MVPAQGILDPERVLVEPAEAERSEVHVPFVVVDLDQAEVFASERLTDIQSLAVPADAPVVPDVADFIVRGILEWREPARMRSR